jgi:hypothetical protein
MRISCDEAGHTGPDLLSKQQRYFAFASVNISEDEAWSIIQEARSAFPVQMPELKASKLMSSSKGRELIEFIIGKVSGRFAINAHDKLLALCGWVFEYVFEPVFQDDPRIFYQKDFHRFIAMFCYLWFSDEDSDAAESIRQFQAYIRRKDISLAPVLFEFSNATISENPHPFELIRRFATANKKIIEADNANIPELTAENGKWTLDLSASALWSHLNHWGRQKKTSYDHL